MAGLQKHSATRTVGVDRLMRLEGFLLTARAIIRSERHPACGPKQRRLQMPQSK